MTTTGWETLPSEFPWPPPNVQIISPMFVGALDIRWDDPSILNTGATQTLTTASATVTVTGVPMVWVASSGTLTVASTPVPAGQTLVVDTVILVSVAGAPVPGSDTFDGSGTTTQIAASIASAINTGTLATMGTVTATSSGAVVTITAVESGEAGDAIALGSSTVTVMASGTHLAGGVDGDTISIGLTVLKAVAETRTSGGLDFTVGGTQTDTATSLAAAINDPGNLMTYVTAVPGDGVVSIRASTQGSSGNAILISTTSAALTLSGATLEGGSGDPTACLGKSNTRWSIVGVNIYRSDNGERGPYVRVNKYPIGSLYYRDFTDNILIEDEVVQWDGSWVSRGEAANTYRWTFRTYFYPIVKPTETPLQGHANYMVATYANAPSDVVVKIDGVVVPVDNVFGPNGEITLINQPAWDLAKERIIPPVLPNADGTTAVTVTYRYSRNLVKTDLERTTQVFYRLTTVALDPTSPSGYVETPLSYSPPVSVAQVETMDYIWREGVRRNNWILQQGGERVKLFKRKVSGIMCPCRIDERTLEYLQQPSNRCATCFPLGTEITMADFTRKPIEQVQEGDEVLTHRGKARRVDGTMSRHVAEDLVHIEATHGVGFSPTGNHPVLVVRRADARCVRNKPSICTGQGSKPICARSISCEYQVAEKILWVRADEVREGDYLAFPIPDDGDSNGLSADALRFLGYYAAEGWTAWKQYASGKRSAEDKRVCFGFHRKEMGSYVLELQDIVQREFGASSSTHSTTRGANGIVLNVPSVTATRLALMHVGKYSRSKRLSRQVVWQPPEKALAFLGAYINGDGAQGLAENGATVSTSSASYDLSRQVQGMLLRTGIIPRFYSRTRTNVPNPGRLETYKTIAHEVHIKKNDIERLVGHADIQHIAPQKKGGWAFRAGGYVLYPIKKVSRIPYVGPVYNLEVEDDHSYIAGGAVAHNCFGTGFVGGYDGPIDIIIAPDDAERRVSQTPNGRRLEHSYEVWTGPSPSVTQRDFLVKQTNERYSIGPVRRPAHRGLPLQQHFNIGYLDEQDIRYLIPLTGLTELPWPQTRTTDQNTPCDPAPPYPTGFDYQATPMETEKSNIPDEREQRGRTPVWANTTYVWPFFALPSLYDVVYAVLRTM